MCSLMMRMQDKDKQVFQHGCLFSINTVFIKRYKIRFHFVPVVTISTLDCLSLDILHLQRFPDSPGLV